MDFPPNQHKQPVSAKVRSRQGRWLGYLAAVLFRPLHSRQPVTTADLKQHSHTTSTQRLGIRFSERIRTAFRHRWLKRLD